MPVDPYGYEQPVLYDQSYDDPWWTLGSQAIEAARQAAIINAAGYPPGSTVVYSPTTQYPGQTTQQPYPLPPGTAPQQQPSGGIQLSTTTLMLIVGGFLLFTLGKRGR